MVKALRKVDAEHLKVESMNPENLSLSDGVVLTEIMRQKAAAMNLKFDSNFWTPRAVEMALWAHRAY